MGKVKLTDICSPKQWKTIPTEQLTEDGYPVYGANGIIGKYPEYNHDAPVIAITCRGATCGNINVTQEKAYVTGNAMCLDNLCADVDLEYLFYALRHYDFSTVISGSAQPQITRQGLGKVSIHLVDFEQQKFIAKTLTKTERIISHRRDQIAKLDELVKCRFVELFGDPVLNEKGWTCSQLGDVANVIGGYAFSSKQFATAGIPVLRIGNINTGTFRKENMVFWSEDEKLTKYLIYPGDIVISLTGTAGKEDYGNVCVMSDDYPKYYLNQRNAVIRPTSCLLPSFLSYYMKSPVIKRKMTGIERGIRQGNISNSDITSLRIPMPPIYLQENFTHMVHRIDKLRFVIQKSLDETQTLFNSLMQQYFD